MTQATNVGDAAGNHPSRAPIGHTRSRHGFTLGILALLGLLCAGAASADSLALMSGSGQRGLGGSASVQPLVVEVRNVDGAVIAGRTINWSSSNGFVPSANSSVTDANGRASVNFTFGNYGTTNILASDPVGGTSMQAPETATGSDSITLISGDRQAGKTGTTSAQPLVVEIRNASGNPVVGRTVNWADQTAYTQVAASTSVTDAGGHASMGFSYLRGPAVGSAGGTVALIRATNSASPSLQSVDASVTVLGIDIMRLVSGDAQSGLIGTISAPVVALVTDWAGNPIAGATVNWADLSGGRVSLSSTSTITDASGHASITYQYLGGSGTVEATFGVNGVLADAVFVGVDGGSVRFVSPTNISGAPGSVSPAPMVIEKRGADNQLQSGRTVTWTLLSGDAVLNAATSVTDAVGRASMGFTYGTVESRVRATVGPYADATFLPVTTQNSLRMISGQGLTGTVNSPSAQPIVVELLNSAGAPVVGGTINWTSDPQITLAAASSITDASGRASVSFSYGPAGRWNIRADDPTVGAGRGPTTYVSAVGIETLRTISGSDQSGLVNSHTAQPLVVELRDAAGQPVAGATIDWAIPSGRGTVDAASSLTDASGRASMGFTYGPTAAIFGMDARHNGGLAAGGGFTAVGANSLSMISGNGQTGVIGAAGAQPLVVEVRDAAGNPVAGRTINWPVVVGVTSAVASSSITNASGRASMGFIYGANPGPGTITATDSVNGQVVGFSLTAIQLDNHVRILSGDGQSGLPSTAGQPVVIEFRDPVTNLPLSGQTVIWSVASGPATLGAATTTSDANGLVHANFNFGATPGTSIIQATGAGGPTHGMLQATVVTLGNNQALTIVSGNNQTLIGSTTSAPLIVQLKNTFNAPVVGATINWTATNGTLNAATSITDANGKASNTVSASGTGPVTVQANSTRASAPVTFNFTNGLVKLPGLTPEQTATAGALDNACPALANKPNLTPQEADLLAQCQALSASSGVNTGATVAALNQLLTKTTQVQSTASSVAAVTQFQNIDARLNALRSGSQTSSLGGLSFNGADGIIPIGALLNGFLSATDNKKDAAADAGFSKWGLFVTGTLGHGAARPGTLSPGYDYDTNGLTFGIDYRKQDNWIFGAALGYSRQDTDLSQSAGSVGMTGYSLSAYNTFTFKKTWYIDSVITLGHNSFDLSRRIAYTLPLPDGTSMTVNQTATSHPGGDFREAALTFGGDFHKEAWNFSPYGQLIYSRLGFDSYSETLQNGPGSGLGLAVNARSVTGLTSILGTRVSFSHSANWGVIVPTASLEWNHEFKSDPQAINAQFIFDPTHTPIKIFGDASDSDYFRLGLGFSAVLPHGESAFLLYERTLDRNGLSQYNIAVGMRLEF